MDKLINKDASLAISSQENTFDQTFLNKVKLIICLTKLNIYIIICIKTIM